MFDDLDETIRQLLIAEMPVKNGEVEISAVRWGGNSAAVAQTTHPA